MSKIKKITVANLKAISALSADFNGMTAIITGGNNRGKSSFLRSFPDRLRGIKPGVVLKHNETEGLAEMELTTGEKFVWEFTGKKEKLTFISERNIPQSVTKDLCKIYFPPVFDVDEFLNSAPAKQKVTLQKLTGIDFTEFDRVFKNSYEERTFANKRVVEEKARLVLIDPDLPKEVVDLTQQEKEYNGIEAHNMKHELIVKGMSDKNIAIGENYSRIAQLQLEIDALVNKNTVLENDRTKGAEWLNDPKNFKKTNGDELLTNLEKARLLNKEIEANNLALKQHERLAELEKDATDRDARVKQLEQERLDVIKNASMPEGFGFSEDGILYEGFPYDKATLSTSKIYIAALKLAAMGLGEVKTLHFDASPLDNKSLAAIEKWASGENLQLLIEMPDRSGGEIEYQILQESANGVLVS